MKGKIINTVYSKKPLRYHDTIPVFSELNKYIENYEQIAKDHIAHCKITGDNPFIEEDLWVQYEQSTSSLITKYSKENDTILDAGVGIGRLLSHFPHLQRYGFDISMDYLKLAQESGIEVCYSLIEELPYKRELFDIVVCTDMLEHVLDLNLAVKNLLNVQKKKGILIVRVPFRENLYCYLPEVCPYTYAHVRNFDENSLRLLFERIFKCKIVEMTYAGYSPMKERLKWPFPSSIVHYIFVLMLKKMGVFAPRFYKKLITSIYNPIEINVVVNKVF